MGRERIFTDVSSIASLQKSSRKTSLKISLPVKELRYNFADAW